MADYVPKRKRRRTTPTASLPTRHRHGKVNVSGDCTGFDSGVLSLRALGLGARVSAGFASDTEAYVRRYLVDNFDHPYIYEDVTARDNASLKRILKHDKQHPDVYTAGWPCQPFSRAGRMRGSNDPRGTVYLSITDTIVTIKPKSFILENVPDVQHNVVFKPTLDLMLGAIRGLKDPCSLRHCWAADFHVPAEGGLAGTRDMHHCHCCKFLCGMSGC